jgi:hypothetical protein
MSMEGVAAMVRAAVWLENRAGLETLSIGRGGLEPANSCTLEICGRQLHYTILLDGGFVFLSVQPLDSGNSERLLGVADGPDGWHTVCRLVAALERSGITALSPKPLQLGTPGLPDCWVIG